MIPERAVSSPTAATRTRRLPPAATVPAGASVARLLRDCLRFARDHRLVDIRGPIVDDPVGGDAGPGPDQDDVADRERSEGNRLGSVAGHSLGDVGQQLGQGGEGPPRLGDRAHLEPVTKQHDGDQRGELPPDLDLEQAQGSRPARDEGDHDRHRDQGHHPGLPAAELTRRCPEEDEPAVDENHGPEDGGDPVGGREPRGGVPEPRLGIAAPDQDRDGQRKAQPELVAEHRDGVTGVLVELPGVRVPSPTVRGMRRSTRQRGRMIGVLGLVLDVHTVSLTPRWSSGPMVALRHCEARQR
jgi:hypothetical protein